jgi:hypothetical protein
LLVFLAVERGLEIQHAIAELIVLDIHADSDEAGRRLIVQTSEYRVRVLLSFQAPVKSGPDCARSAAAAWPARSKKSIRVRWQLRDM